MADTVDGGRDTIPRRPAEAAEAERSSLTALEAPPEPTVSVRELDVLRTRLELLHDMNDRDRREREQHRRAVQAAVIEMQRQVADVQRDHRGIRQTVGDLATMVRRQSADGSAVREAFDALRTAVLEVREEGRAGLRQLQREQRRAVERVAVLEEQLGAALAALDELGVVAKRQAGQITRLRADLKKATAAPATADPAKRTGTKKAAARSGGQRGRTGRGAS